MELNDLKNMISLIEKYHPELMNDWVAAEHDIIYLSDLPDDMSDEFKEEIEKLNMFIEEDSITAFC